MTTELPVLWGRLFIFGEYIIRFTPLEMDIVRMLVEGMRKDQWLKYTKIVYDLYIAQGRREPEQGENMVRVLIHKIRTKFKNTPFFVAVSHGEGYKIGRLESRYARAAAQHQEAL
jgi:DNA-binding response OmpR family regulator